MSTHVGIEAPSPGVEAALLDAIRQSRAMTSELPGGGGDVPGEGDAQREQTIALGVAHALYGPWYARWSSASGADAAPLSQPAAGRGLVESLRAAHADTSRWEEGWKVERVSSAGRVIAAKEPVRRVLDPIDYLNLDRPGLPPHPGASVLVCARRDSTSAQAGYWVTFGQSWSHAAPPADLVRLYWNVTAEAVPLLVAELTAKLGDEGIPYSLKCPVDSPGYLRADTAVTFLPASSFDAAATAIRQVHTTNRAHLGADVPRLTKRLAPGLGVAEDPEGEESFGLSRCRLVAEGLAGPLARGESDEHHLLAAVCRSLQAAGIPLGRPHLRSWSSRDYEL